MYTLFSIVFFSVIFFMLPNKALASEWFYPMERYFQRQTVKRFGQLINDDFYKGKETFFPFNRFYGYHAGVDLEVFDSEKDTNVPVFAVGKGPIVYIGNLEGYGGVILQRLDSEDYTVLYGHVKITSLSVSVNDKIVVPGQKITYLGDGFSIETSRERKHLHLGIYKGNDLYFKGHESTEKNLINKWIDPSTYLKNKNAIDPGNISTKQNSEESKKENRKQVVKYTNLFYTFINWFRKLFKHE